FEVPTLTISPAPHALDDVVASRALNGCDPFPTNARQFASNASPADNPLWTVEPAGTANIVSPNSPETDIVFTQQPGASPAIWRIILVAGGQTAEVHVTFRVEGPCP